MKTSSFVDENNSDNSDEEHSKTLESISTCRVDDYMQVKDSSVISLELSHRGIGNERALCLVQALNLCPNLVHIDLTDNRLNDATLFKLLAGLFQHTVLLKLNVSENSMGAISTQLLGRYIQV